MSPNRMCEGTYTQELMLQIHPILMGMLHSQGRMKKNANVCESDTPLLPKVAF